MEWRLISLAHSKLISMHLIEWAGLAVQVERKDGSRGKIREEEKTTREPVR